MPPRRAARALVLSALALAASGACGSPGASSPAQPPSAAPDAGDAGDEQSPGLPPPDAGLGPPPGPVKMCVLDNGSDPVALCSQKALLAALRDAAFQPDRGVAESWDSTTFLPDQGAGGAVLHDLHDDFAYAAAIARYHASAGRYGDTELTPALDDELIALAPLLRQEIGAPPDEYAGELYFDARAAAAGLRYLNDNAGGDALDAGADAFARAALAAHDHALGAGDGVLGGMTPDGRISYRPADVASGALMLMDLAARSAEVDPAGAAAQQTAARRALDHIAARALDPGSGLFHDEMVVTGDPAHDAPVAGDDLESTRTQARVALALLRAEDLLATAAKPLPAFAGFPAADRSEALVAAIHAAPAALWDAAAGGFYQGYVPSKKAPLTDKSTAANALMLAVLHRRLVAGRTAFAMELKPLREVLVGQSQGFLTALPHQSSDFAVLTQGFTLPAAPGPENPRPGSYVTAATTAVLESLDGQSYGTP